LNDFFSVIALATPLDAEGLGRMTRHSCLDIHQVQWLRTYLAKDGSKMLCWYHSLDAESVRLVLRQQTVGDTTVWPAEVSVSDVPAPANGGDILVLEFHWENPESEGMASGQEAIIAALEGAGLTSCGCFRSRNGTQLILVIEGGTESAVSECLQSCGIAPSSLWLCEEHDARPTKLFEAIVPVAENTDYIQQTDEIPGNFPYRKESEKVDALIIGAGVSGICTLHRLLSMGLRVKACESASDVGGVWHWNRYPGARVDSETYTYGFSFSDELLRDWHWQELFASQPEIRRYLHHVVDRFDLRRHIDLNTKITTAIFDETTGHWLVDTNTGRHIVTRYLLAASGALSTPQMPSFSGMIDFTGPSFHTARWPAAGIDLEGKRVGVVGTGASGVQVIQTIASQVQQLTVFQRTPTYCVPLRNRRLTDEDQRQIRSNWEDIFKACHSSYGGFIHNFDPRSGLAVSAREREEKFEALWRQPGFSFWFSNFADLMMNLEVNNHASDFVRTKIRQRVLDSDIARKLLPDHPFGTKRIPLEINYYEAFNRDNVQLVDVSENPIEKVTASGILTSAKEYPLDIIVYATGFDAGTGPLNQVQIHGKENRLLSEKWSTGPKTFLGLLVNEFPNLFIVNGPQNAAALCNATRCIETNVNWIAQCIEYMRSRSLTRIEASAAAEEEWTQHVNDSAEGDVLSQMKDSWFFGANTPGKARKVTIYAPGARVYREHCEDVANAGYKGCKMS
jgi:cation diffusion facilitator CzcD-associated flavoprotein CzcO